MKENRGVIGKKISNTYTHINSWVSFSKITILAGVLTGLSLLPILVLGHYTFPQLDDFNFGAFPHIAWVETGSFLEVLRQAAENSARVYSEWQGSFVACFLMGLQPGVFGDKYYGLTTVIILGTLCLGIILLCRAVFTNVLKVKPIYGWYVSFVLILVSVQLLPSAAQAFYWYNGGIFYTFFFGLGLLFQACCLWVITGKSKGGVLSAFFFACLLGFVIGGGNYITAPASLVVLLLVILAGLIKKNKRMLLLIVPAFLMLVSLGVSLASPGNQVRQELNLEKMMTFTQAVVYSFYNGAISINAWLNIPFMVLMVLLVPVFWHLAGKVSFRFSFPLIVVVGLFCFQSALFFPHLRSMGTVGPPRLYNILYLTFVFLFSGNLFYVLGWLRNKTKDYVQREKKLPAAVSTYFKKNAIGVFTICAIISMVFALSNRQLYSTVFAVQTIRTGEAAAYKTQMDEIGKRFTTPEENMVIPSEILRPELLGIDDDFLSDDKDYWLNRAMARYYGKETVSLEK